MAATGEPRSPDDDDVVDSDEFDLDDEDGYDPAAPDDRPDVHLDIPHLSVDEISLEVEQLRAKVSLQAEVLELLKLNVGVDVALGRVSLEIKGVEAQALLQVRLDNVAAIIERVLVTIDRNPEILEHVVRGAADAVEGIGRGAGAAVEGVGGAVGEIGEGVGSAVGEAGRAAGETVAGVTGTAGEQVAPDDAERPEDAERPDDSAAPDDTEPPDETAAPDDSAAPDDTEPPDDTPAPADDEEPEPPAPKRRARRVPKRGP